MSSIAASMPQHVTGGRRAIKLAALLAAGAAVFGTTLAIRDATSSSSPSTANAAKSSLTMPKNAQLEQKWGVQFKSVTLPAAAGGVDVRYPGSDVAKAEALHTSGRTGLRRSSPIAAP